MGRFTIYKRKNCKFFYAQLKNPATGKYLPAKSTKCTDRDEALLVVADWLKNGFSRKRRPINVDFTLDNIVYAIQNHEFTEADARRILSALKSKGLIESAVTGKGDKAVKLVDFLLSFWDYDHSEYVRDKLDHGQRIGRRHCFDMTSRVEYWRTFFTEDKRLIDVTREELKEFQRFLKGKDLSPKTVNMTLNAGSTAFRWAQIEKGLLHENPAAKLRSYRNEGRKRGILTPGEVQRVFSIEWPDNRARVGNLIACTCGLRAGEIIALTEQDIKKDRILVNHSWSRADGLKAPKNGETRQSPLLPAVRDEILQLITENPHKGKNRFIFYGPDPEKPMQTNMLMRGFERALVDIQIKPEDRTKRREELKKYKERGIVFHSWRHYFAANLADRIDLRTVQLATGHKSGVMAEHYANHAADEHFQRIAETTAQIFGNVIAFPGKTKEA